MEECALHAGKYSVCLVNGEATNSSPTANLEDEEDVSSHLFNVTETEYKYWICVFLKISLTY